jgi:hypothetical protein
MPMKKSSDTIGNRNRDLPVCSAVPQPTAPPQPHKRTRNVAKIMIIFEVSVPKEGPHSINNSRENQKKYIVTLLMFNIPVGICFNFHKNSVAANSVISLYLES